jgi:hypothetical protein
MDRQTRTLLQLDDGEVKEEQLNKLGLIVSQKHKQSGNWYLEIGYNSGWDMFLNMQRSNMSWLGFRDLRKEDINIESLKKQATQSNYRFFECDFSFLKEIGIQLAHKKFGNGKHTQNLTVFMVTDEVRKLYKHALIEFQGEVVGIRWSPREIIIPNQSSMNGIAAVLGIIGNPKPYYRYIVSHVKKLQDVLMKTADAIVFKKAITINKNGLRATMDNFDRQHVDALNKAENYKQNYINARFRYERFDEKAVFNAFDKVRKMKSVKDVSMSKQFIVIRYAPGLARVGRGRNIIVDDVEIQIPISMRINETRFYGKGINMNRPFPHHMGGSSVCFGNALTQVTNISELDQIEALSIWARSYILSVNLNDSAGRDWWQWPLNEIPEEREWAAKNSGKNVSFINHYLIPKNLPASSSGRIAYIDRFFLEAAEAKKSA